MKNYLMDWGFPENQFYFLNKGQLQIWHSAILHNGITQDLSSSYEKKNLSYLSPQKKCYFRFSGTVTSTKNECNTLREGLSGS